MYKIPFTNYALGKDFEFYKKSHGDNDAFNKGSWQELAGTPSSSGVVITQDNAMTLSGVYNAVSVYADAIASLPINVIQETEKSKEKLFNHPLTRLLSKEPNSLMTSYAWRQIFIPQLLLWGNSINLIEFQKGGSRRPIALMPLHPSTINKIELDDNENLIYFIELDDRKLKVDSTQVLHFRGKGDNIWGKSVIDYAKDNLGLGKATEDFGAAFYKNGANANGILMSDNALDKKAYQNLEKSWNKSHKGANKSHKTAILEQGMKYETISIPQDSAQFIETKRFSIEDIARWFKLPPHMIADLSRATFTNIDAQDLNLVKHSILPMVINIEQEIDRKLFREQEKSDHYIKMNLEGLLRGDIKTRYEAHRVGIQNGFMTPNEARRLEGMNPIEGLDNTWMQTNTAPIINGTNQQEKTNKNGNTNE